MKSKLMKIVKQPIALLLAVCMTVTLFVTPSSAEEAGTTGNSGASSEKIDECKTIVQPYTAKQASNYIAGDNTYPTLDGYVFGGWYTDAACTNLLDGATPSGTTYALFVPNHVLSVKAQISSGLTTQNWQSKEKSSIRFVTTVDSLRYDQIGFEISYVDKEQEVHTATKSSTQVYNSLYECGSNDKVWEATPKGTFCGLSQYFSLCTLKDFTLQKYFETAFTIKPYWITADGDKVYGVTATKSMKEGCLKQEVSITINETENGTVTKAAETYKVGDTVQLTATPNEGYNLTSLTVTKDGAAVDIGTVDFAGGTYSFVTEGGSYVVNAEFKQKIFVEANSWDLTKQYEGEISLSSNGQTQSLTLYGQYTNFDFTIKVKDDPTVEDNSNDHRTTVKLTFDETIEVNGESKQLSIWTSVHESPSSKWVVLQNVKTEGNTYDSNNDTTYYHGEKEDAEWQAYHTAEGIDYRVVRQGTNLLFYLNGTCRKTIDLSSYIDADTQMTASIIHHNGDTGAKINIPYTLRDAVSDTTINLETNEIGTLQIQNSYKLVGDEIVISQKELNDSNYYLAGLKIDDKEVELALDGTYRFVATKSEHTVEGIYKEAIFDSNGKTNVSLVQQNQSTEDGVTTGTIWVTDGKYTYPVMKDSYKDIDFSINIKDGLRSSDEVHEQGEDHRRTIKLTFDKTGDYDSDGDSENLVLCISVSENLTNKWLRLGSFNAEGDTYPSNFEKTTESNGVDWKAYHTAEGVDFRVVRQGTTVMGYLNGTCMSTLDLSSYIDADTTMKVTVIYHGGESGQQFAIPYALRHIPSNQINIVSSEYGSIAMTSTNNLVGEEVVFKQEAWLNEEYYLSGLIIDGTEVELDSDGTYRFVTTKSVHTVEGVYREAIFAPKATWNLAKQNLSTAEGVTTGEISLVANAHDKLEFQKQYTDMDLTLRVKDDQSDSTQGRTSVEFTFDNGATLYPSIGGEGYFQLKASTITNNDWDGPYNLNEDELALYQSEGIDFRIVRNGTVFTAYITDVTNPTQMKQIWTADYEEYIDADTKATVAITHDDDKGIKIVMPFVLKVPQEISSFQGESEDG